MTYNKRNFMQKKTDKDGSRTYTIEGIEYPSVTTILKQWDAGKSGALMGWAVKMMAEYLQAQADPKGNILITKDEVVDVFKKAKAWHKTKKSEAAELGSEVHNLIEVYLKGQKVEGLIEANPKLLSPFTAFKAWQNSIGFEKVIQSEHVVYSNNYGFAGTLDLIAKCKGRMYLIDLKSSNHVYEEYLLQISAYLVAYEEMIGFNAINNLGVLRLDKESGLPEFVEYNLGEASEAFEKFKCLLNLWKLCNKKEEKCIV